MTATTDRRMQILEILLERRNVKVNTLMIEFNVSRSTILRDVQVLSCSYPILTIPGSSGGIRVANGFRLGMKYLTVEQSNLLENLSSELTGRELAIMQAILETFTRPVSVG